MAKVVSTKANTANCGCQEWSLESLSRLLLIEIGKEMPSQGEVIRIKCSLKTARFPAPLFLTQDTPCTTICSSPDDAHSVAEEVLRVQGIKTLLRSFHKTRAVFKGLQSQLKNGEGGAEQIHYCLRKTSRELASLRESGWEGRANATSRN